MRAIVKELFYPFTEGIGISLYQVDYTWQGHSPDDEWFTFGVYEREEVAKVVKKFIEAGDINPMTYIPLVSAEDMRKWSCRKYKTEEL